MSFTIVVATSRAEWFETYSKQHRTKESVNGPSLQQFPDDGTSGKQLIEELVCKRFVLAYL